MKEKINREDVEKIAKLANLDLSEGEKKLFAAQLSEVIDYNISLLKKVDTGSVAPVTNITGLENVLRKDEAAPALEQKDALANAKETHNGFFKVKAVLE